MDMIFGGAGNFLLFFLILPLVFGKTDIVTSGVYNILERIVG
jgi:hypothetical protein